MRLVLGTAQFGINYGISNLRGQVSSDEVSELLSVAMAHGINTLDTAASYGDSEAVLGEIGVGDFRVVTKLPAIPNDCLTPANWLEQVVDRSLRNLRLDRVDVLLLHRPADLLGAFGPSLSRGLQALTADGLVGKLGYSVYSPEELASLSRVMWPDCIQAPLNLLDRRLIDSGWLDELNGRGTEIHVRSAFLQGLLLMQPEDRPSYFSRWDSLFAEYDKWLALIDMSPLEAALGYVMGVEGIDKVVVGVTSARELAEIIDAAACAGVQPPATLATTEESLINPSWWPH